MACASAVCCRVRCSLSPAATSNASRVAPRSPVAGSETPSRQGPVGVENNTSPSWSPIISETGEMTCSRIPAMTSYAVEPPTLGEATDSTMTEPPLPANPPGKT